MFFFSNYQSLSPPLVSPVPFVRLFASSCGLRVDIVKCVHLFFQIPAYLTPNPVEDARIPGFPLVQWATAWTSPIPWSLRDELCFLLYSNAEAINSTGVHAVCGKGIPQRGFLDSRTMRLCLLSGSPVVLYFPPQTRRTTSAHRKLSQTNTRISGNPKCSFPAFGTLYVYRIMRSILDDENMITLFPVQWSPYSHNGK